MLANNSRLNRPFTKDNGGNWQTIKSQTEAHLQRGLEKGVYERLNTGDKALYEQVRTYLQLRNQCSQLWHELKGKAYSSIETITPNNREQNNKVIDRALKPWENEKFDDWKNLRNDRESQEALLTAQIKEVRQFIDNIKVNKDR